MLAPDDDREPLLAALRGLRAAGCPVVGQDEAVVVRVVDVAVRRWRSARRRGAQDGPARERDLLTGLLEAFAPDPLDRGPLVRDWLCVVHALVPHLGG